MIYPTPLATGAACLDLSSVAFLAWRARKAYAKEDEIAAALSTIGGRMVTFWNHGTCEAFLAVFGEAEGTPFGVLAFRGTEPRREPADLKVDLAAWRVRPVSDADFRLHAGFWRNLQPLTGKIINAVESLGDVPVYLCGHSKGGAEAVIMARLFSRAFRALVTIGAPRSLDAKGAAGLAATGPHHYRVVNRSDIVPLVPTLLMGYRHDCRPWLIGLDGEVKAGASIWREIRVRALDWRPGRGIARHDATAYCEALESAAKKR